MPPLSSSRSVNRDTNLDALLSDLGGRVRRGEAVAACSAPPHRQPTGLADIDQLLEGGFPSGHLCEIAGPSSSGRTSLAMALLASTTRAGECAALVDGADAFDPASAEALGVVLERVLWARLRPRRALCDEPRRAVRDEPRRGLRDEPHEVRFQPHRTLRDELPRALRCAERLLETEGFPLVVLDLTGRYSGVPAASWIRLSRLAAASGSALVLLSTERLAGSRAEVALEMQPARARFTGEPALLEELETQAVLVRHRSTSRVRSARLRLEASTAEPRASPCESLEETSNT